MYRAQPVLVVFYQTERGIARVIFTVFQDDIVLVHGFIKKSQRIPKEDLDLAKKRMRSLREGY